MARRIALLIGNSEYADPEITSLSAPWPDVKALDMALKDVGDFETTPLLNAGLIETRTAIGDLFANCAPDDVVMLYYTGHGVTDEEGELFFALPQKLHGKLHATSLEADFVKKAMRRSRSDRQVLILDCCYSGAFYRDGSKRVGDEARLRKDDFIDPVGRGRYVLAASSARQSAFEINGQSVFTKHLVDGLKTGSAAPEKETITIRDLHNHLCRGIAQEDMPMQPHLWADAQTEELVIGRNPRPVSSIPEDLPAALHDPDRLRARGAATHLIEILEGKDPSYRPEDARKVLAERIDNLPYWLARMIQAALDSVGDVEEPLGNQPFGADLAAPTKAAKKSNPWEPLSGFRDVKEPWCPRMTVIPAGRFLMGSPENEKGRNSSEGPQHEVEIAQPFALARLATTFVEYDAFCDETDRGKPDDEGWGRHRHPVINVSWNDARAYCAWLSEKTGAEYRLPSEAEWEYACRAGTTTRYSFGDEISKQVANYGGKHTVPTDCDEYSPNPFTVWQMHGNVWEWCEDDWVEHYREPRSQRPLVLNPRDDLRVLRGGSWYDDPRYLRSADRGWYAPGRRGGNIGFRPARTLVTP